MKECSEGILEKIVSNRYSTNWWDFLDFDTIRIGPGIPVHEIVHLEPGTKRKGRPRIKLLEQVTEQIHWKQQSTEI